MQAWSRRRSSTFLRGKCYENKSFGRVSLTWDRLRLCCVGDSVQEIIAMVKSQRDYMDVVGGDWSAFHSVIAPKSEPKVYISEEVDDVECINGDSVKDDSSGVFI